MFIVLHTVIHNSSLSVTPIIILSTTDMFIIIVYNIALGTLIDGKMMSLFNVWQCMFSGNNFPASIYLKCFTFHSLIQFIHIISLSQNSRMLMVMNCTLYADKYANHLILYILKCFWQVCHHMALSSLCYSLCFYDATSCWQRLTMLV